MVVHSFHIGKQDTPLYDGVIVSKSHLEHIQKNISLEMRNAHEFLHRSLVTIATIKNEATYGINDLLDD